MPPTRVAKVDSAPRIASKPSTGLTVDQLRTLERGFEKAYKRGNIDRLMQLFSVNARSNGQESAVGIRRDYVELFRSSAKRDFHC